MIIYKLTRAGAHPRPPGARRVRLFMRIAIHAVAIRHNTYWAKLVLLIIRHLRKTCIAFVTNPIKCERFAWRIYAIDSQRINASWYVDAYCADVFANVCMGMKWISPRISKYGIRISKYGSVIGKHWMPWFRASFDFERATRKFFLPSKQAGKISILHYWFDKISKTWD